MTEVKICGLSDETGLTAAIDAGARYVGFVFFPASPRNVSIEQAAALARMVPPGVASVGLFVNPENAALDAALETVPLDFIQIHKVSDPARLGALRARAGLPLIAAVAVAEDRDIHAARPVIETADLTLFDAKAPKDATLPGGNGLAFDWRILANYRTTRPWMLAGGLTPENVADAVRMTGAARVDVSSGVESAPGQKDPEKIRSFVNAAQSAGGTGAADEPIPSVPLFMR